MSKIDKTYKKLIKTILKDGKEYTDKSRDVKRLEIPLINITHSFNDGFPALSLKKLAFKSVVGELIWFLRGQTNTKYLHDNKIKIWDKDAFNHYKILEPLISFDGFKNHIKYYSIGYGYGYQWRKSEGVDQVKHLIDGMIENIHSTRNRVEAWNKSDLDNVALPPCHTGFQCVGFEDGFILSFNMRSVDVFLGLPFNIASYSLLGCILELITGHKFKGVNLNGHCVHLYENQIEPAKKLIKRSSKTYDKCGLKISDKVVKLCKNYDGNVDKIFDNMEIEDFELVNYKSYENIKVEMLAPKNK